MKYLKRLWFTLAVPVAILAATVVTLWVALMVVYDVWTGGCDNDNWKWWEIL